MSQGLFITFEGGEGSGKTTVLREVIARLQKDGYKVMQTREPGGNKIAEQIREVILDKANTDMDPRTEALLYAASRRQHLVQDIIPELDKGVNVICDRYIDSSLAYQGYARGIGVDEVFNINMFAIDNKLPDLTILFDIEPEIGLARISANSQREVNRLDLEALEFHKKVHVEYMMLASKYNKRIKVVDASLPLEEVIERVYEIVKKAVVK